MIPLKWQRDSAGRMFDLWAAAQRHAKCVFMQDVLVSRLPSTDMTWYSALHL